MELRWAVCLYRVCIRSGSETTVACSQREVQAGCSADAEDTLKVKADRMTGVSVGMMPPRLSSSCLGSTAAPQPGREQEGCWWKCTSSLELTLRPQQVKWSKWDFVDSLEPCCLTCQFGLPLLWAHVSYSDP